MAHVLSIISSDSIFLLLRLSERYWQILVEDQDRPKTACVTKSGFANTINGHAVYVMLDERFKGVYN